jgi:hypothetical protein
MGSSPRNDEASILCRAIDSSAGAWTPGVAQAMLSLALSPADKARMNELAARSQDGSLAADEQLEIESYRQACRLLDLMQAKARLLLEHARDQSGSWL